MFQYNTIEEALEDLRQGKMILCTDDPDRENEGDLICAAEFATTENVNFMATHGKGLICMPMSYEYVRKLQFPQMVTRNTDNHETAFTVSIDHVDTTTGISAAERSLTAMKCVDPEAKPEDFRRPGHMFPLLAKDNGVLERNGHTEATVDLMRLAGLKEVGLCCEIMREDGTMMRAPELQEKSKEWGLKFITIRDLQNYRKRHEVLVDRVTVTKMPTKYGDFMAYGYVNKLNGQHHVALVKGDIGDGQDLLCRVHSECLTGDTFGSLRCDCGQQLAAAMTQIEKAGLRPPGPGDGHPGGQPGPGLCRGPAGVLHRRPDSPGPGGQDPPPAHQQPRQGLPAGRLRHGHQGAGAHPDGRHPPRPLLPPDQAEEDGAHPQLLSSNPHRV